MHYRPSLTPFSRKRKPAAFGAQTRKTSLTIIEGDLHLFNGTFIVLLYEEFNETFASTNT